MKRIAMNLPQISSLLGRCIFLLSCFIMLANPGAKAKGGLGENEVMKSQITQDSKQQTTVNGKIVDENGEPLIGVSIKVKGTTTGTISDTDGSFSIKVPSTNSTLIFSFLGFVAQEVTVGNSTNLNIVMKEDAQALSEVVVTALGIKRDAKKLGYAVSNISSSDLTRTGTPNLATSLYGKAAGVRIQAAPGGSTSAVSINIRGLNSITGTNQPLVIVDGVPIRNGEANKDGYWTDQRINSNGLVDINPEDIENVSILKGVSASALYGSEAANGVVMITTKSGKGSKGLGVDYSMVYTMDKVSYLPEYQKKYGPGLHHEARGGDWATGDGWQKETYNGKEYYRPQYETSQTFGPRFDGRDVIYWDGSIRPYNPSTSGWNDIFRTGIGQTYNLAITHGSERSNMRFSYTLNDNRNTQRESNAMKHNFNFTGSSILHKRVKVDYTATYMRQSVENRPYRISRITNNFGGLFSTFDDVNLMYDKTISSLGYINGRTNDPSATPEESLKYRIAAYNLMNEYFWGITNKRQEEGNNRFIGSVTPTITLMDGLTFRGRVGTDFTSNKIENFESTEKPIAYGATGNYRLKNYRYEIYYGDLLLMLDKKLNETWGITANAGYQGRIEREFTNTAGTKGGLAVENWFHLNASYSNIKDVSMYKSDYLKQALLGTLGVSFKDYLFLEGTARHEKTSTLRPGLNSYFYPSVNGSFLFSEALKKSLPAWYDYGKIRASWGIVGNAPLIYRGFPGFEQGNVNESIYNLHKEALGNYDLKSEKKHEMEFGIESKFFKNRLGFEITYYKNVTEDQILETSVPWSSGARSVIMNVGELQNTGLEISMYGTPIQTKDFKLELRGNLSFNSNKVNKLIAGLDMLQHSDQDGAVQLVSRIGHPMGDLMTYVPKTDGKGNKIVDSNGLYEMDYSNQVVVGNILPDAVGGVGTTLNYKNFALDMTVDFSIGGDVLNTPYQYLMGRGSIIQTMKWRDAENGGLSYYYDSNNNKILAPGGQAPGGQRIWDDGIILPGVKADGTPNDVIVTAGTYYNESYNWGVGGNIDYSHSIFKNTYVKMRELALSYTLPSQLTSKFGCRNLSVSAFGRNLFYFYKAMPIFDAEATDGTTWMSKAYIGGSTATSRTFGVSLRASF